MRKDDESYFRRRAVQEQVAAQRAACEVARLRHEELATMYRFRSAMSSKPVECRADGVERQLVEVAA
jgi:hypothetical protein